MSIIVKIHNGYFYAGKEHIPVDGQVVVISARSGASYEIVQSVNGKAPAQVKVAQRDNDLHISVDDDDKEDIVIKDFFLYPDSQLVGLGDDGDYYTYLPDQSEYDALFGKTLNPRTWYDKYIAKNDADHDVSAPSAMQRVGLYRYGKITPWLLEPKTEPMGDLLLPVLGGIGMSGLLLLGIENAKKDNTAQPPAGEAPAQPVANINDDGTQVTGTGDVGSTIRVFGADGELGTATVDAKGNYTVTLSSAQVKGETLRVSATKDGSAASTAATVTAPDTLAPEKPEEISINDEGTEVTGKAEAGSTVNVLDEFDNIIGSGQARQDGSFNVTLLIPQTAEQALKVQVVDGAKNKSETVELKGIKGENGTISAPTDIDITTNAVAEDAKVGDKVGVTVKATDYEAVTYSLTNDADGKFAIDSKTGVVTLAAALDYETSQSHQINVRASSADGTLRDLPLTIRVTNVNDNKVTEVTDSNDADNSVAANATVGTEVGVTASATDADGDEVTYRLVDNADGKFSINTDTGVILVSGDLSKTTGSVKVTVAATSTDKSTTEASFDIDITAVTQPRPLSIPGLDRLEHSASSGNTPADTSLTSMYTPDITQIQTVDATSLI